MSEYVGVIGVECGQRSSAKVVRKTARGPLHRATCNRWARHDGPHRHTRGTDFALLHEWGDDECETPDWKTERRREMAVAKAVAAR